jgi:hypothetical protein
MPIRILAALPAQDRHRPRFDREVIGDESTKGPSTIQDRANTDDIVIDAVKDREREAFCSNCDDIQREFRHECRVRLYPRISMEEVTTESWSLFFVKAKTRDEIELSVWEESRSSRSLATNLGLGCFPIGFAGGDLSFAHPKLLLVPGR